MPFEARQLQNNRDLTQICSSLHMMITGMSDYYEEYLDDIDILCLALKHWQHLPHSLEYDYAIKNVIQQTLVEYCVWDYERRLNER